jgi:hypothetical protein
LGRKGVREREREREGERERKKKREGDVAYTMSIIWHVNYRHGNWEL